MDIDYTWLEENFFKQRLSDEQKALIADKIDVVEFDANDIIVKQGSKGGSIYVVHSGTALIECDLNGEKVRVGKVGTGDLIGEMSFLTDIDASATVTAKEDCVIYKLPRSSFSELMRKDQELAYAVFAHLLQHTADVIRDMNAEKAAIQHYMAGSRF